MRFPNPLAAYRPHQQYPEGSIGYEFDEFEARVRAMPWWLFFVKRRLLHRLEACRNTIAFRRDAFVEGEILRLYREVGYDPVSDALRRP